MVRVVNTNKPTAKASTKVPELGAPTSVVLGQSEGAVLLNWDNVILHQVNVQQLERQLAALEPVRCNGVLLTPLQAWGFNYTQEYGAGGGGPAHITLRMLVSAAQFDQYTKDLRLRQDTVLEREQLRFAKQVLEEAEAARIAEQVRQRMEEVALRAEAEAWERRGRIYRLTQLKVGLDGKVHIER